ncbi:MAG: PilZ domain-containing protein [Nitrospiraceae bacterium]|nr:PilZ domain-containing protein [Nitrospiraceae bacterium]
MGGTIPQLSEQEPQVLWREPRRSVRAVVDFRMIVADKAGLASGQVIDMTARGCGLRLTKVLKPGQYLTLMVYPGGGPAAVPCDVGRVSGSKETGRVSPSCLCRWRMSVGCTNSAATGSGSRTRCSRNVFHMYTSRTLRPASPPVRPSGWMSVAPAVFQWTAAGPCGMAGGISSVDCSACFHGGAMGAGSDFI